MRRRAFIAVLIVLAAPAHAWAQSTEVSRRVGVITPYSERDEEAQSLVQAFRKRLAELGWIEGRNTSFEYRWTGNDLGRMRVAAEEIVAWKPQVIFARATPATAAVQRATRDIPIVFTVVADPVGDRLVDGFSRPGGNTTGFTSAEPAMGGKWLELLSELLPRLEDITVMYNPKTTGGGHAFLSQVEDAGRSMQVKVVAAAVSDAAEIEKSIAAWPPTRRAGLIVLPDVTTLANRSLIISLAAHHRVPAVYPWLPATTAGGLISYGVDYVDLYRRSAEYVDRILRGAKPGDLPVQRPTKFVLAVNKTAAKALGITVPHSILLRADRVIE